MDSWLAYFTAFFSVAFTSWFPQRFMGSLRTPWYECIKPSITPPNYVFPIVWTTLYILIGIVFAQVLMMPLGKVRTWLIAGFVLNLILNILWTYTYFGKRLVSFALVVIVFIWLSIILLMRQLKGWHAWALSPYLAWISFATLLNALSALKERQCE